MENAGVAFLRTTITGAGTAQVRSFPYRRRSLCPGPRMRDAKSFNSYLINLYSQSTDSNASPLPLAVLGMIPELLPRFHDHSITIIR